MEVILKGLLSIQAKSRWSFYLHCSENFIPSFTWANMVYWPDKTAVVKKNVMDSAVIVHYVPL